MNIYKTRAYQGRLALHLSFLQMETIVIHVLVRPYANNANQ